jgi:ATP-dependent protease ClpP protease subunit
MDMNTLQYVVGEAKAGQPAVIRFFGRVTEETTSCFNDEFDFLENIIRPSCIRVLINSEGGSVLYGMSTYSTIANATVDTECIIEGVAASMASIIWAAGKRSLMRDYAILMIHNPMLPDDDGGEPSDMVTAFTKQIETIYRKRFGLKAEHVRAIMDGQAGKDGTYFDAQAAVKAGIIPAEHVIHTSKQLCRKVHDEIEGLTDTAAIQELMSRVSAGNKPFKGIEPTLTETENDMANENKTQGFEYGAIAASLGMKDGEVKDVMARISELAAMEPKYREIQKSLSDAQTVIAGKDASIRNLQTDLAAATARLSAYEQKEKDEQASRIETLVENAIAEGKIDREAIRHAFPPTSRKRRTSRLPVSRHWWRMPLQKARLTVRRKRSGWRWPVPTSSWRKARWLPFPRGRKSRRKSPMTLPTSRPRRKRQRPPNS